jgi:hypothetical protein
MTIAVFTHSGFNNLLPSGWIPLDGYVCRCTIVADLKAIIQESFMGDP